MLKVVKLSKKEINLPIIVIIIGIAIGVYHWFSYLVPFTNNAFVATNITPIAADVSGYVTKLYVKHILFIMGYQINEQKTKWFSCCCMIYL